MDFDYSHLTDPLVTELERRVSSIVDKVDDYKTLPYNEFDSDSFLSDISDEINDYVGKINGIIEDDVVSDIHYYIDDLNSGDDDTIIEAINRDKDAYNYVIDPSETVINFYKFLYEL